MLKSKSFKFSKTEALKLIGKRIKVLMDKTVLPMGMIPKNTTAVILGFDDPKISYPGSTGDIALLYRWDLPNPNELGYNANINLVEKSEFERDFKIA